MVDSKEVAGGLLISGATRRMIDRILSDAKARAERGDVEVTRDLLVLALDVSGGHPEILLQVGDIRETLPKGAGKKEIEPSSWPALDLGSAPLPWQAPQDSNQDDEHLSDIESGESTFADSGMGMDTPVRAPALSEEPAGWGGEDGYLKITGRIDRTDDPEALLEPYQTKKRRVVNEREGSRRWILYLLVALGGFGYWYVQPEKVAERDLSRKIGVANSAWEKGQSSAAAKAAMEVLVLEPNNFEMQLLLARARMKTGPADLARTALLGADSLSSDWRTDLEIGKMWVGLGMKERAAVAYFRAFSRGGESVGPWAEEIIAAQMAVGQTDVAERIRQMLSGGNSPRQ